MPFGRRRIVGFAGVHRSPAEQAGRVGAVMVGELRRLRDGDDLTSRPHLPFRYSSLAARCASRFGSRDSLVCDDPTNLSAPVEPLQGPEGQIQIVQDGSLVAQDVSRRLGLDDAGRWSSRLGRRHAGAWQQLCA